MIVIGTIPISYFVSIPIDVWIKFFQKGCLSKMPRSNGRKYTCPPILFPSYFQMTMGAPDNYMQCPSILKSTLIRTSEMRHLSRLVGHKYLIT